MTGRLSDYTLGNNIDVTKRLWESARLLAASSEPTEADSNGLQGSWTWPSVMLPTALLQVFNALISTRVERLDERKASRVSHVI